MLIDLFSSIRSIYCAESSEIITIECLIKNLRLEKDDTVSNNETRIKEDNNKTDEAQGIRNFFNSANLNPILNPSPILIKTDFSISRINLLEDEIFDINFKFKTLLKKRIPRLLISFNEILKLHLTIKNDIKEIEIKIKNNSSTFFKKVKDTVRRKQEVYLTFIAMVGEIKKSIVNLMYILIITYIEYQKIKTTFSSDVMNVVDKFNNSAISKIAEDEKKLSGCLESVQKTCNRDKKQADNILAILKKILVMKPKEFENDEEVSKAISSLK